VTGPAPISAGLAPQDRAAIEQLIQRHAWLFAERRLSVLFGAA
jgi:hypothetical protein